MLFYHILYVNRILSSEGVSFQENEKMSYVEKLVVYLHDTFSNPKRVLYKPPFRVKEEGYAGFVVNIEIYFKGLPSGDSAKMVKLEYDLHLIPNANLVTEGMAEGMGVSRENRKTTPRILTIHHKNKNFLRIFEEGRKSKGLSGPQSPASSKGSTVSQYMYMYASILQLF